MKLILVTFFLCLSTSAFSQSAEEQISAVVDSKKSALNTFGSTPYREKEYISVRDYFITLNEYGLEVKNNSRSNKRLNSYLAAEDIAGFCSDIFVSKSEWEQIKTNCTKNRFFLCSDEVLLLNEYKKNVFDSLSSVLKVAFSSAVECQ